MGSRSLVSLIFPKGGMEMEILERFAQNELVISTLVIGVSALAVIAIFAGFAIKFFNDDEIVKAYCFVAPAVAVAIVVGILIGNQVFKFQKSGARMWQDYASYQAGELSQEEWHDMYCIGPWPGPVQHE